MKDGLYNADCNISAVQDKGAQALTPEFLMLD